MMSQRNVLKRKEAVFGESPLFYDDPVELVRGEGVHLFDSNGKRYLDCYNNIPIVGHCNKKVVEAVYKQANRLNIHSRYLSEEVVSYAERLISTFDPELDKAIFTCSGSEANDQALRIARLVGRGRGIICTDFAYHGNTSAVNEVSPLFKKTKEYYSEVRYVPFPQTYRSLNGLSGEDLIDAHLSTIQNAIDSFVSSGVGFAGIIICPIFANEGLPNVPKNLLGKICKLVRSAGGIVIADEVQAGFGRTGSLWAHKLMDFVPDLVTIGKPMANGYPMAGVIGRSEILDFFREKIFYFNTFAATQVAAAAANAVLDVIHEEELINRARKTGDLIRQMFRERANTYTQIDDIRGHGLWVGIEFVKGRDSKEPASKAVEHLINSYKENGVLLSRMGPYDNVLKIRPPLIFEESNLHELMNATDCSLRSVFG